MDTDAAVRGHRLALGADMGGTSTRVVVVDATGAVLGRGVAGGGNPVSAPDSAATAFGDALGRALLGIDPARVVAAVIGVAGGSALGDPRVRTQFDRVWGETGMACAPDFRSDLEVAFAAGTAQPHGSVLIAGTGAVAGLITNHRLGHTVDGHGWLVGDDGSGYWLGREAVRATLRTLEGPGQEPGLLAHAVLRHLGVDAPPDRAGARRQVIHAVHARPPVRLADLAPLVTQAYGEADAAAVRIVDQAARLLADTLGRLPTADRSGPVVLAGSLTRPESPVGARLRDLLADSGSPGPVTARDEVLGAAWLALVAAGTAVEGEGDDGDVRTRLQETDVTAS